MLLPFPLIPIYYVNVSVLVGGFIWFFFCGGGGGGGYWTKKSTQPLLGAAAEATRTLCSGYSEATSDGEALLQ